MRHNGKEEEGRREKEWKGKRLTEVVKWTEEDRLKGRKKDMEESERGDIQWKGREGIRMRDRDKDEGRESTIETVRETSPFSPI